MGRERKLPGVRRAAHLPAVQQRLPGPAALQAKRAHRGLQVAAHLRPGCAYG